MSKGPTAETDSVRVAQILTESDAWIIPQPKEVFKTSASFELEKCRGVFVSGSLEDRVKMVSEISELIQKSSGVSIPEKPLSKPGSRSIVLDIVGRDSTDSSWKGLSLSEVADLKAGGYALHVDSKGVCLVGRDLEGLHYGMTTLVQLATDRKTIPGMHLRDWPSLAYRGAQKDICRGQVPTQDTFKKLIDVMAQAKMNIMELYIEHTFKFVKYPDISPPEGITPAEAREINQYGAEKGIYVHPLFQVLGHSGYILDKPAYRHLRIRDSGPMPWTMTFDVRKPEAIAMVNGMIDEICEAFPGPFLNVDITEIDFEGLGMTPEQATDLVFDYVLKLNEMVKRHGKRLMIAQGPLDSLGHLAGMGPKLDKLPKDIIIGSYYCAGGVYQPAWEKDFPRLREKGFSFFSQAWIYSHSRLVPWPGGAADFSDLEVERGLKYGAMGSTTTDWGDEGNFHLVGQIWYSVVYHGASAWTGAKLDRKYFDQAYTRLFFGIPDDSVAQAIQLSGNITAQKLKVLDAAGKIVEQDSNHLWEIFSNPFGPGTLTPMPALADFVATGEEISAPASEAVKILENAGGSALRNSVNLEQLLLAARMYQALGRKLIVAGHYLDSAYPRDKVKAELAQVAQTYKDLRLEYEKLWLSEDRENDNYHRMCGWFDQTILPCEEKAKEH